jgi:hypothetical protein
MSEKLEQGHQAVRVPLFLFHPMIRWLNGSFGPMIRLAQ